MYIVCYSAATLDAKDNQAKQRRKSARPSKLSSRKRQSQFFKGSEKEHEGKVTEETEEEDAESGHIFISYNWDDQALLKRVRDEIKRNGYKVSVTAK